MEQPQRTVQHLSRGQGWRLCECLAEELGFILYNRAPYLVLKKERRLLWLPICIQLHLPDPAVWVWIPLLLLGNGMALGKSDAINMWMKLRMTSMIVLLCPGIEVVKAHRAEGQKLRSHDRRGVRSARPFCGVYFVTKKLWSDGMWLSHTDLASTIWLGW